MTTDRFLRFEKVKAYFMEKDCLKGYSYFMAWFDEMKIELTDSNLYEKAVSYELSFPATNNKEIKEEVHHIQPRFAGGSEDVSNCVSVSYRSHCFLHFIRYITLGDSKDFSSATVRVSRIEKNFNPQMRGKLLNEENKRLKRGWYNSNVQSLLGKKGGSLGGSRNSEKQQLVRKNPEFSKKRGMGNQSDFNKKLFLEVGKTIFLFGQDSKNTFFVVKGVYPSITDLASGLHFGLYKEPKISGGTRQNVANALNRNTRTNWKFNFYLVSTYSQKSFDSMMEKTRPDIFWAGLVIRPHSQHSLPLAHWCKNPQII